MKKCIIAVLLCLPFFCLAQKESFVSNGSIIGAKFDKKIVVVSVDWQNTVLTVSGVPADFVIESKEKDRQTGEILSFCHLENGQSFVLVSDNEGLRGLYCPRTKIRYDVGIGDIYAEMKNGK